ncbi:hypothetical protein IMSAG049_00529 [Clostridiales bacterium]|nr:hypothetical protein IMSAG049_00529 [Clostridiales bacterium]
MSNFIDNQQNMKVYYKGLMDTILADGKKGLVPMLEPKFVDCDYSEASLTLGFKVKEWMINPEKILFGGAMVSMLDNTYGFLCHYFAKDKFISTISLNTTFLKPGRLNDIIHVKAKAVSHGRTIVNMSGEVFDVTQNIMIGTSQTSFMILDKKVTL